MSNAADERREYRRLELSIPMAIVDDDDQAIARAKTSNISKGGVMVFMPAQLAPPVGSTTTIRLSVPAPCDESCKDDAREILCRAKVLRHQPDDKGRLIGVAMEFLQPIEVELESNVGQSPACR